MPLVLSGALLAACGSEPAHSDYFIVTFMPGVPAPTAEGTEALDRAVRAAGSSHPRFVRITGAQPADNPAATLEKQRADAIAGAFVKEGIAVTAIRTDLRPFDAKDYDARKDGFILQLGYGELPQD